MSLELVRADPRALRVIRQWQSPTDEIRHAPESARVRFAVWGLALAICGALAAAPFVQIARVVTSTEGHIVSQQPLATFQALDPSIIRSVDVKEGQQVARGQLLATLDPTFAAADVGQLRSEVAGLDAQLGRARAEAGGRPFAVPPGLPPGAAPFWAQQKALFDQRAAGRSAQLKSFDEKIGNAEATLAKLAGDQARFVEREKITRQVENMRASLYRSGASSLVALLGASDERLKLLQSLDNGRGAIAEEQQRAAGLRADRDAFERGWRVALDGEIVAAQNGLDAAAASLGKALRRQDLVRLVAPRPAVVLRLSKLSVGSVLKQGDELMQLAPLDAPVEAEVRLRARDIGLVRVGDPVALKVAAFDSFEHGEADGRLSAISENAFTDGPAGQPPTYKARVSIDAFRFRDVPPDFRLVPGMTLVADVRVGTRSAFAYVVGSLSHGAGEAMRDP